MADFTLHDLDLPIVSQTAQNGYAPDASNVSAPVDRYSPPAYTEPGEAKDDDLFADIRKAGNTQNKYQQQFFDYDATKAQQFINTPQYKELGFDPNLGYQVEDQRYHELESNWETTKRVGEGFAVGLGEGFAGMVTNLKNVGEWFKDPSLQGSFKQKQLEEINKQQQDFQNRFYIPQGYNPTVLNSVARGVQGSGNFIGALAEVAAFSYLTGGLAGAVGGVAGLGEAVGAAGDLSELSAGLSAPEIMANTENLTSAINNAANPTMWEQVGQFATKAGQKLPLPGAQTAGYIVGDVLQGSEGGAIATVSRGFAAFANDINSVNTATGFASSNAANTYQQLVNDQVEKYKKYHNGIEPDTDTLKSFQDKALKSAKVGGAIDAYFMLGLEKLALGNLLNSRSTLQEAIEKSGKGFYDKIGIKPSWAEGAAEEPLYIRQQAKWYDFKANLTNNYYEGLRHIGATGVEFGVVNNLMEGVDKGIRSYFDAKYDNKDIDFTDALLDGIGQQFSKEGAGTFISGFLQGALLLGIGGAALGKVKNWGLDKAAGRTEADIKTSDIDAQNYVQQVNDAWKDPLNPIKGTIHDMILQSALGEGSKTALGQDDRKTFHDFADDNQRSFLMKLIKNGMADAWVDRAVEKARSLSQDELCQFMTVPSTPENFEAIKAQINELPARVKDLRNIRKYIDTKLQNPFNPWAKDPETGKRKFADGSVEFTTEYNNRAIYEIAKDYVATMKDVAQMAIVRQGALLNGKTGTTGILDMPFAKNLGFADVFTLTSTELLDKQIAGYQESVAISKDKETQERLEKTIAYKEKLTEYLKGYADILNEGSSKDRAQRIKALDDKHKGELAEAMYYYLETMLINRNLKGKVTDRVTPPGMQEVIDGMDKMLDYYKLGVDHHAMLHQVNILLDPHIVRKFEKSFMTEGAKRQAEAKAEQEAHTKDVKPEEPIVTPEPETKPGPESTKEPEVPPTPEPQPTPTPKPEPVIPEVPQPVTTSPAIERYKQQERDLKTLIDNLEDGVPVPNVDAFDAMIKSGDAQRLMAADKLAIQHKVPLQERKKELLDIVQEFYDRKLPEDKHEVKNIEGDPKIVADGNKFAIWKNGDFVDSTRYGSVREANREFDKYIAANHPLIPGTDIRVGEKVYNENSNEVKLVQRDDKLYVRPWNEKTKNKDIEIIPEELSEYSKDKPAAQDKPVESRFDGTQPKVQFKQSTATSIESFKQPGEFSAEGRVIADQRFADTVKTIPQQHLSTGEGFSIQVVPNDKFTESYRSALSPQLVQKADKGFWILHYNGQPVGVIENSGKNLYKTKDGKELTIDQLTLQDIAAIYDIPTTGDYTTSQKVYDKLLENHLNSLALSDLLKGKDSVELDGKISVDTNYSYNWIDTGEVGPKLAELEGLQRNERGEVKMYVWNNYKSPEEAGWEIQNTMSPEEAQQALKVKPAGNPNYYSAVVKLESGDYIPVQLTPRQISTEELSNICTAISGIDTDEKLKAANGQLNKVFVALPKTDELSGLKIYINSVGVGDDNHLFVTVHRKLPGKDVPTEELGTGNIYGAKGELLKLSPDELIDRLNKVLQSDKIKADIPTLTVDNLKFQPDEKNIAEMEASVRKNPIKSVQASYKVIDTKGEQRVYENKPPVPSAPVGPKTPVTDIEAKRGDIERRRQEELISAFGSSFSRNEEVIRSGKKAVISRNPELVALSSDPLVSDRRAQDVIDVYNTINQKYDTELKALEQQPEIKPISSLEQLADELDQEEKAINSKYGVPKTLDKGFAVEHVADIDKFNEFVNENLPEFLQVGELSGVVDNLLNNRVTVGQFVTYLDELGNVQGRIETGKDLPYKYHEAFHGIFRLLLTPEQQKRLYQEANKQNLVSAKQLAEFQKSHPRYADMGKEQLKEEYQEEWMADQFDNLSNKRETQAKGGVKGLLNRIWDWIKYMWDKLTGNRLRALFHEVHTGDYKSAKLQENSFTDKESVGVSLPVPKAIKVGTGETEIELSNGDKKAVKIDRYLPNDIATQLSNDITANVLLEMQSQTYPSFDKAIKAVIQRYSDTYSLKHPANIQTFEGITNQGEKREWAKQLKDYSTAVNSKELRENVEQGLRIQGIKQQLLDEDDTDETTGEQFGKAKSSIGGYGAQDKELRTYIASTTRKLTEPDSFGLTQHADGSPITQSVNSDYVYNGLLKLLSQESDVSKNVQKLLDYRDQGNNPDTVAVITRWLRETGFNEGLFKSTGQLQVTPGGENLFNKLVKNLSEVNNQYTTVIMDPIDNKVSVVDAGRRGPESYQFNQAANGFYQNLYKQIETSTNKGDNKKAISEAISPFKELIKTTKSISAKHTLIEDQPLAELSLRLSNELSDKPGIYIHPNYIQFSIVSAKEPKARTENQSGQLLVYPQVKPMDMTGLERDLLPVIEAGKNPFIRPEGLDKPTAAEVWLLNTFKGNAPFDSTVDSMSHTNSNGDSVYNYQYGSYNSTEIQKLNDSAYLKQLRNNPDRNTWLLDNPEFTSMTKQFVSIGGLDLKEMFVDKKEGEEPELNVQGKDINKTGTDFGDFGPREDNAYKLSLYDVSNNSAAYNQDKNGVVWYSIPVSLGPLAEKGTHHMVYLPVTRCIENGKLTDKVKDVLYQELQTECDRIQRVKAEIDKGRKQVIDEGGKWITDYHDGKEKGLKLLSLNGLMSEELRTKIEAEPDKLEEHKTEFLNGAQKELFKQVEEYKQQLTDQELIGKDGKNKLLPKYLFKGLDEKKNSALNLKAGQFDHNLSQVYINNYISYLGISRLLYGDKAKVSKDVQDWWKRMAGNNGQGMSMNPIVSTVDKPAVSSYQLITYPVTEFTTIHGTKGESDDGQANVTPYGYKTLLEGTGRLSELHNDLIETVIRGKDLTLKQFKAMHENDAVMNSIKDIYKDTDIYLKNSVGMLNRQDTSYKVNGEWVALPGREVLHERLNSAEEQEKEKQQPVFIGNTSISKAAKVNVPTTEEIEQGDVAKTYTQIQGEFMRWQTQTPMTGSTGNKSTQPDKQILSNQDANKSVYFDGKHVKAGEVIKTYMDSNRQRVLNNLLTAISEVFEPITDLKDLDKIEFDQAKFQDKVLPTLMATGVDAQTLELFQEHYDINLPPLVEKATSMWLSGMIKGVSKEKVPMWKMTLRSDAGMSVMRRVKTLTEDGQPKTWDIVPMDEFKKNPTSYKKLSGDDKFYGLAESDLVADRLRDNVPQYDDNGKVLYWYSEAMRPFMTVDEKKNGKFSDALGYGFGARTPGTGFQSYKRVHWVDRLSDVLGNTMVQSRDVMTATGEDLDIDSKFVAIPETYFVDNSDPKELQEFKTIGDKRQEIKAAIRKISSDFERTEHYDPAISRQVKELRKQIAHLTERYDAGAIEKSQYEHDKHDLEIDIASLGTPEGKAARHAVIRQQNELKQELKELDKRYDELKDSLDRSKKRVQYGAAISDKDKFEEYLLYKSQSNSVKDKVKELEGTEEGYISLILSSERSILISALKELKLPSTLEEFTKAGGDKLNNGVLTNRSLHAQLALLSGEHVSGGGKDALINRATSTQPVEDIIKDLTDKLLEGETSKWGRDIADQLQGKTGDLNSMLGQNKAYETLKQGGEGIGGVANMIQATAVLNQFNKKLSVPFTFGGVQYDEYKGAKGEPEVTRDRNADIMAQIHVDAPKNSIPSKLKLTREYAMVLTHMLKLGLPLDSALLYPLTEVWDRYAKKVAYGQKPFKLGYGVNADKELSKMLSSLSDEGAKRVELNNEKLTEYIKSGKSDRDIDYTLLDDLRTMKQITEPLRYMSRFMRMDTGRLLSDWTAIDHVQEGLKELGIGLTDEEFHKTQKPLDVRDVIEKRHGNMSANYEVFKVIQELGKKVFIERSPVFRDIQKATLAEVKLPESDKIARSQLNHDIRSYISLTAYKTWLDQKGRTEVTDTMNQNLLWDNSDSSKSIIKVLTDLRELTSTDKVKNYALNSFLNTVLKAKRTEINTVIANTWTRLSDQQQAKVVGSINDMVGDKRGSVHKGALTLLNYLFVKDGGQYKNGSFIRFIPPHMMREWSDRMSAVTKALSKPMSEEQFRDLFGTDQATFQDKFVDSWATHKDSQKFIAKKEKLKEGDEPGYYRTIEGKLFKKQIEDYMRKGPKEPLVLPELPQYKGEKVAAYKEVFVDGDSKQWRGAKAVFGDYPKSVEEQRAAETNAVRTNENNKYKTSREALWNQYQIAPGFIDGNWIYSDNGETRGDLEGLNPDQVLQEISGEKTEPKVMTSEPSVVSSSFMRNITFKEHPLADYPSRTRINASSDATLALATDFTTPGEKLTKNSVTAQGKKYIPIDLNKGLDITPERVSKIVQMLNESAGSDMFAKKEISLNIAGNGIYTLKSKYTQQQLDEFTYKLLKAVTESPDLKVTITSANSGGQTGMDEAGAKATQRLGIPTTVLAPKGYMFRDINHKDIANEQQFKQRFEQKPTEPVVSSSNGVKAFMRLRFGNLQGEQLVNAMIEDKKEMFEDTIKLFKQLNPNLSSAELNKGIEDIKKNYNFISSPVPTEIGEGSIVSIKGKKYKVQASQESSSDLMKRVAEERSGKVYDELSTDEFYQMMGDKTGKDGFDIQSSILSLTQVYDLVPLNEWDPETNPNGDEPIFTITNHELIDMIDKPVVPSQSDITKEEIEQQLKHCK